MTSPSTLIRKAKASRSPRTAAKLRKEAAALRRSIRAKAAKKHKAPKKAKKAKVKKSLRRTVAGIAEAAKVLDRQMKAQNEAQIGRATAAGPNEHYRFSSPLVADHEVASIIERVKRKGVTPEEITIALHQIAAAAQYQGRSEAERTAVLQAKQVHERNGVNVVSAFMAEMEALGRINGGPLPLHVAVAGFTVARIIDALRDAGYTAETRGGAKAIVR